MPIKIKIALMLGISFYLMLLQCQISDAQNLQQLSYGNDVQPAIPTSTVPPTTTKKSGFFSSIKNFFSRGESSSTTISSTTAVSSSTFRTTISSSLPTQRSPSQPQYQPTSQGNHINPNIGPNGLPISTTPQRLSPQPNSGQRDFINPNLSTVRPYSPGMPSALSPPQTPQLPHRDYVNPNIGRPSTITPGSQPHLPSSQTPFNVLPGGTSPIPQPQPPRRDYVNPNIGPTIPNLPGSQPPYNPTVSPGSSSPQPQPPRRDYVNPNIPMNPTRNPISPSSLPTPNLNSGPQFNNENFPPLPPPRGRPAGQNPPNGNTRPNMVSFIPGQSTTTQRPANAHSTVATNQLATDEEITTLTEALFTKDVNNQNSRITINYQGQTRSSDTADEAARPLLQVDENAFQAPTISKMRTLLDNYELDTTVNEFVTPLERGEENNFVDEVMGTSVMRHAMTFLKDKGIVTPDPKTHRDLIKTIWFSTYSRGGGRIGSSAFEHIFVSEIKNGTVTGLHNWIYYYDEEKAGRIDYKGYIKKLDLGTKGAIIKYRFDFHGISKPVNAMFIGTSPELEMALYTICFELRPDKECPISLAGNRFNIRAYTFRYRGKTLIGSAFPEI